MINVIISTWSPIIVLGKSGRNFLYSLCSTLFVKQKFKERSSEVKSEVGRWWEKLISYSGTKFSTLIFERKSLGILLLTFKSSIPKIFPFSSKSIMVLLSIFLLDA